MPLPKSQLEKRIDELYVLISSIGGGVGLNVGRHNEIFNDYDNNTITGGDYNHVIGEHNTLTNATRDLIAGGWNVVEGSQQLFVMGYGNKVSGNLYNGYGALFGYGNKFIGTFARSIGFGDSNECSYAEDSIVGGNYNNITGNITHSAIIGRQMNITAPMTNCAVFGNGHRISSGGSTYDGLFVAGNSATVTYDMDALMVLASLGQNRIVVTQYGDLTAAGSITPGGADYAEYFEWADGNPDNEDRRGMLVALEGDKLVPAHGDDFIGIVSAAPSVIGNGAELNWSGKYKTDVFGAVLRDENGKPILSDSYDSDREYVPRSKRSEWAAVGLVGRLVITDNGSCKPGGYVSARNGTGTPSNKPTAARVLRRIDSAHVEVLIR